MTRACGDGRGSLAAVWVAAEGLPVLFAVWCSAVAALSFLSDLLLGSLRFGPILLTGTLLTLLAARDLAAVGRGAGPRSGLAGLMVTIGLLGYFIGPSLPDLFPLGARWDGANHLAVTNFLKVHGSHRIMIAMDYSLSWGGDLKSYPWGLHAVVAGISRVSGIDPLFLFHPLTSLAAALVGAAWTSSLLRRGHSPLSVAAGVVFTTLAFSLLFHYNYWGQVFGILIVVALVQFSVASHTPMPRLVPIVLLGGLALVYPLLAPAGFAGFFAYCLLSRKLNVHPLCVSVLVAGLIGTLYLLPYLAANVARVTVMTGPGLWAPAFTGTAFVVGHTILAWRLVGCRDPYAAFPLAFLPFIAALYLLATPYWPAKCLYSSLFLLPPALATLGDWIATASGRLPGRPVPWMAQALLVVGLYFSFPPEFRARPATAVTAGEYRILNWSKAHAAGKEVFFVRSAFKLGWFEAIAFPDRIGMPPNMRELAERDGGRMQPGKLVASFFTHAKPGDLIAIEWHPLGLSGVPKPEGPYWVPRDKIEGWLVLERTGVPL